MKNSASGNSKIRKFFAMQGDLTKNPPGLIFENEHEVKEVGRIRFSAIDP